MTATDSYSGQPGQRLVTSSGTHVQVFGRAKLPTRYGDFEVFSFLVNGQAVDHVAVIRGDVTGAVGLPTRVHSECLTGDVFGSLRCDCRDQLEAALENLGEQETGAIVYMRQEGRGIGLAHKVRAYALQDDGMDTVDANIHLGFDDDLRSYEVTAAMLLLLGVRSIRLCTNNPKKVEGIEGAGLTVTERVSIQTPANPHNRFYLNTKRERSGHILDASLLKGEE